MSDLDRIVSKLENIEGLFREDIKQFRTELLEQIGDIWRDQKRQDNTIVELIQRKIECVQDFDDKLASVDYDSGVKINNANKSWWRRMISIYGIVILIIGFLAIQGAAMKNEISDRLTKTDFSDWKKTEMRYIENELSELRKDVKEALNELDENQRKFIERYISEMNKNKKRRK